MKTSLIPTSIAALALLAVTSSTIVPAHTLVRPRLTRATTGHLASTSLPALGGEQALAHLKKEGLYSSLGQAVEAARYGAQPSPSGSAFQFLNAAHGLSATFDAGDRIGTRVAVAGDDAGRELAIKLSAFGYGRDLLAVSPGGVDARQNRVEYTHRSEAAPGRPQSSITEWFVNTTDGIEHGFVLPAPPAVERAADAPLRVEMKIGGDFRASLEAETQTVLLTDKTGDAALRYDKLRVYDANQREVPAQFELSGNRLAIVVDDDEARYPLTIDPLLAQNARLTAGDGEADDHFGFAVAISGDTAVVGVPNHDAGANADQGAVYVFTQSGGDWAQQGKLTADDGAAGDLFGTAVDVSGNTLIVGASLADNGANANQGSAYVFVRSGGDWTQQGKLTADDGAPNDVFGFSVTVDGDTAIVGANLDDNGANANRGAAYVFARSGGAWSQTQKLTSSDGATGDLFGVSVALDAGTVVIGASGKDEDGAAAAGAAYVFTLAGATWTEQQKLVSNDSAASNFFGVAVAVSGDTVLVGCSGDDIGADADRGAAFVFVRDGATWTQQQKLTAADGSAGDNLGLSVALDGDTAVVGVIGDDLGVADQGSAYLFSRSGTAWSQQSRLFAAGGGTNDRFGASVAISGDTVLVGAAFNDVGSSANQGAASVFVMCQGLARQQELTANNGAVGDHFGYSVAISGDTVVVGARYNSPGGNPLQGSAYVFVRDGTTWTQEEKLTAADGNAFDRFGTSVAISGGTVIVGSPEASVGANSGQGAAYVFVRDGTTWTQEEKLTAADGNASDKFGTSVAIGDDRALVGAPHDDIGANTSEGSAYVFARDGSTWTQEDKLQALFGSAFDVFGTSVAINGDRALVGAPDDDIGATADQGSAYVFVRGGSNWTQEEKLTASDGNSLDAFGASVAISGDTALAGAPGADVGGSPDQGSAYVFVRGGTTWTQEAELTAADSNVFDRFGASVAVSGDMALVGAPRNVGAGNPSLGAAFLFVRGGTTWTQPQQFAADDTLEFGVSAAISGDTAVVGALFGDPAGIDPQGSAFVFVCAPCPAITLDPAGLSDGTAGRAYNESITASGGAAPYNYSLSSGALPEGLALDPTTGALSGTPETAGTYTFTITATARNLCPGGREYTLVVDCRTIAVRPVNPNLPLGRVGTPYNRSFTATGGLAPYTFSIGAGALPDGLTLDPATGALSGTPTASGTFSFAVQANDSRGCFGSTAYVITTECPTIRVNPANPNLPPGTAGAPYLRTFTATGGSAPHTFSLAAGALPSGLTLDPSAGALSGTPTATGTFSFEVHVADGYGCSSSRAYVLTIDCPTITVGPGNSNLSQGVAGTAYLQTFSATGGTGPHTFEVATGTLPVGLTLDAATGALSGTPTASGTFNFVVRATDGSGCSGQRPFRIVVN